MKSFNGDYYIGLDMGTSSVGWAVTDPQYNILRAKGKDLWGVRMFDEADTAASRRMIRTGRRRRAREVARINMLKELLEKEIEKVDPGFIHRLDESKFWFEDKTGDNANQKFAIFAKGISGDDEYTDVQYYRDYPTIFHLRKELAHSTEPHDIRLLYLALLNMFKHRGHFLNEALSDEGSSGFGEAWSEFIDTYRQIVEIETDDDRDLVTNCFESVTLDELKELFLKKGVSKTQILEEISGHIGISKKNQREYKTLGLLCGLSAKPEELFGKDAIAFAEDKGKKAMNFRKSTFEEDFEEIREILGENQESFVLATKKVHDALLLDQIMQGEEFLCDARVNAYEKHKSDLKLLKKTIKRLAMNQYSSFFRKMEDGSYSAYVGSTNSDKNGGKVRRYVADHSTSVRNNEPDELYKHIRKILTPYQNDADVHVILNEVENGTFLRKQLTSANGVIPNQIYVREMKAILKNAEVYFPFLKGKDESNLTVSERILMLFKFRVPYFVGPLGNLDSKEGNKWAVRLSGEKITPWNIEDVVDYHATQQAFIEKLIRHCTYIKNEKVLPKHSLLYEKFMVLNELNNLKIAGEPIKVELKQDIYNDLFMKGKPVTLKKLCDFLVVRGKLQKGQEDLISGIDRGFNNSLSSVGKFNGIFNGDYLDRPHKKMIEEIIRWGTAYGESRKLFAEKIEEVYGENSGKDIKLTKQQIKRISGFKFSEWGRFSKNFLEMKGASKEDGVERTIIDALGETNDNLMQLLSDSKYTYAEELQSIAGREEKELSDWTIDDLDNMYLSAPVKRMVWQTLRVLHEIEEVMGKPPKRVFVEMTRSDGEKGKRTKSRKSQLLELYKNAGLKKESRDWMQEIASRPEQEFRIKKLYLYYCQMGRCMYTGEPIDLNRLMDDNMYDIDHIYPRHYVKDDSIENNLVLVKKEKNAHKSDVFPIEQEISLKCGWLWEDLLRKNLISKEKYNRLTRRTEFTLEEKASFVQRQIVETSQGTKAITEILREALPKESDVVFSKASVVSDFREQFDIFKARSVNDFHHAQDAYLNIVVGNVYFTKFTCNPLNFMKEVASNPKDNKYHLSKMFDYSVKRGGEIAWISEKGGNQNTIINVKKQVFSATPLITRRSYVTSGPITGKDTIYGKQVTKGSKDGAYFPQKTSDKRLQDVTKYGGKSGVRTVAYTLISYIEGGKEVRSLDAIPSYMMLGGQLDEKSKESLLIYLKDSIQRSSKKECRDFKMLYPVIKFNSLMKIDGYFYYIAGRTNESIILHNAVFLKMSNDLNFYLKKIEKAISTGNYEETDKAKNYVINSEKNKEVFNELVRKMEKGIFKNRKGTLKSSLEKGKDKFETLNVEEQCKVIQQILLAFVANTNPVDLSLLGQSKKAAVMVIPQKITGLNECTLINQSVTGLYENSVNLLKL